jgi:hypothetical protein
MKGGEWEVELRREYDQLMYLSRLIQSLYYYRPPSLCYSTIYLSERRSEMLRRPTDRQTDSQRISEAKEV